MCWHKKTINKVYWAVEKESQCVREAGAAVQGMRKEIEQSRA